MNNPLKIIFTLLFTYYIIILILTPVKKKFLAPPLLVIMFTIIRRTQKLNEEKREYNSFTFMSRKVTRTCYNLCTHIRRLGSSHAIRDTLNGKKIWILRILYLHPTHQHPTLKIFCG